MCSMKSRVSVDPCMLTDARHRLFRCQLPPADFPCIHPVSRLAVPSSLLRPRVCGAAGGFRQPGCRLGLNCTLFLQCPYTAMTKSLHRRNGYAARMKWTERDECARRYCCGLRDFSLACLQRTGGMFLSSCSLAEFFMVRKSTVTCYRTHRPCYCSPHSPNHHRACPGRRKLGRVRAAGLSGDKEV